VAKSIYHYIQCGHCLSSEENYKTKGDACYHHLISCRPTASVPIPWPSGGPRCCVTVPLRSSSSPQPCTLRGLLAAIIDRSTRRQKLMAWICCLDQAAWPGSQAKKRTGPRQSVCRIRHACYLPMQGPLLIKPQASSFFPDVLIEYIIIQKTLTI
jgi:hypothetical protein